MFFQKHKRYLTFKHHTFQDKIVRYQKKINVSYSSKIKKLGLLCQDFIEMHAIRISDSIHLKINQNKNYFLKNKYKINLK